MEEVARQVAGMGAATLELTGVALIVVLSAYALAYAVYASFKGILQGDELFREVRHRLVRGILMGLDLLVAGDIVHTVAIELTFTSVGVLAGIVLIRTLLSFTLELEMSGRWPWQGAREGR